MYLSIKAHYENGQVILDEPMPIFGNSKGLYVILDDDLTRSNATALKDGDFLVNEQSLAKDWLSEEDNRWDSLLKG
ncbi:MAG: hypothetical protein ACKVOU_05140 [Cytophagales bacterium]